MPPKLKHASVNIVKLKLADLKPAEYNARNITNDALAGLAKSMEQFGVLAFPVVNKRPDGYRIVGGHQRIDVLTRKGATEVDCVVVEFDETMERQANFALNNKAIQGAFIPEMTKALLDDINKALGTSEETATLFEELRFDALMKQITRQMKVTDGVDNVEAAGKTDDDSEVSVQKTSAVSKQGSYYRLGDHVLYCGKIEKQGTLSGFPVERADAGFMYFAEKRNVTADFIDVLLGHMLANVDGPTYLATTTDLVALMQARFVALGGHWSNTLVWFSPESKADPKDPYRDVILPVLYGWRDGSPHYFCGSRDQGNVFKLKASPKAAIPVEVVVKLLLNSTKANTYVLDPCVGKGASVIAAEKTKRRVIGYVWSPREMDAVRKRWTAFVHAPGTNWQAATPEAKP